MASRPCRRGCGTRPGLPARLPGTSSRGSGCSRPTRSLRDALATEQLSQSWAEQFARWNDRLPDAERDKADQILLDAARAGLPLRPDIARLAQAIYEAVKGQQPDTDPDDDGFADRGLRLGTTLGVPDLPQAGGMKTQALVVISLADLIAMDGGSVLAQKWLAAQDEKLRATLVTVPAGRERVAGGR